MKKIIVSVAFGMSILVGSLTYAGMLILVNDSDHNLNIRYSTSWGTGDPIPLYKGTTKEFKHIGLDIFDVKIISECLSDSANPDQDVRLDGEGGIIMVSGEHNDKYPRVPNVGKFEYGKYYLRNNDKK